MDGKMGNSVRRKEDYRLLRGQGAFTDDNSRNNQTYATMVRSPHAHARIMNIDKSRALATTGVIDVLTSQDLLDDGLKRIPHVANHSSPPDIVLTNTDGSAGYEPAHFALPIDKARYVGEVVAVVIANNERQARDAAELVDIDYKAVPSVTDTWEAADRDAPVIWDQMDSNICVDAEIGTKQAVDDEFAGAHYVSRLKTTIARITGVPMEPRSAFAIYENETDSYIVYAGSGGVVRQQRELAYVLGVEKEQIRVIAGDVGGNFGTRNPLYVEIPLVAWAAKRVGRPVKWTGDRSEIFLTDCGARDLVVDAELAFDENGNILALRSLNIGNLGAQIVSFIPVTRGVEIMNITYRIPKVFIHAKAVVSNTPPTYPYRSAGRPEVHYVMERLIDQAAVNLGMDRIDIRRKNMVTKDELPYENRLGLTYDCGDFIGNMDIALKEADWDGFAARKAASETRGRIRGIGISNYIDLSTGVPVERTEIDVKPHGEVEIVMGTGDSGQGHATSFAQLVSEELQVGFETIRLVQGDTLRVKVGGGTHSGRSMRMGAIVIAQAVDEIIEKGRQIASNCLEVTDTDIQYENGQFRVIGTDYTLSLFEVAKAAQGGEKLPEELTGPLAATAEIEFRRAVFGNGAQVVEVEVDPDTGVVELVRYTAVDDVGNAINPLLIHGQTHGGIAQGVGQALMEACSYDPDTGQMRASTFLDYAMPRASDLLFFDTAITEIPSPTNRLGIKPGSEGGTAPAPAVISNAIVDALSVYGIRHLELPISSQNVWRAIQGSGG